MLSIGERDDGGNFSAADGEPRRAALSLLDAVLVAAVAAELPALGRGQLAAGIAAELLARLDRTVAGRVTALGIGHTRKE